MGVAVSVSTSIWLRRLRIASLCRTPKRCSSSMMTRPMSLNDFRMLQQPVRTDDDIDCSGFHACDGFAYLFGGLES